MHITDEIKAQVQKHYSETKQRADDWRNAYGTERFKGKTLFQVTASILNEYNVGSRRWTALVVQSIVDAQPLLTAAQFDALCTSLRDAAASLRGCQLRERPNERRILQQVLAEVKSAKYHRNARLDARRATAVELAEYTLKVTE